MPTNVALYGPSGSGKSTVAKFLGQRGYQHLETGQACRRLCRELFQSESKNIMNRVTDALREIDSGVWLRAAMAEADGRPIVFDSMRFESDYVNFRNQGYLLVRIIAGPDQRLHRLKERGQPFDLEADSLHPAEVELLDHDFDVIINNDGDVTALERQVLALTPLLQI